MEGNVFPKITFLFAGNNPALPTTNSRQIDLPNNQLILGAALVRVRRRKQNTIRRCLLCYFVTSRKSWQLRECNIYQMVHFQVCGAFLACWRRHAHWGFTELLIPQLTALSKQELSLFICLLRILSLFYTWSKIVLESPKVHLELIWLSIRNLLIIMWSQWKRMLTSELDRYPTMKHGLKSLAILFFFYVLWLIYQNLYRDKEFELSTTPWSQTYP